MSAPLWAPQPDQIADSNLAAFCQALQEEWGVSFDSYDALWRWSIDEMEKFWPSFARWAGVRASEWGHPVLARGDQMPGATWFPGARLNFAENLLRRRDEGLAIRFWGEDQVRRSLSHADLYNEVSRVAQALRAEGVEPGDRVAALMPNLPEAIIAMLAATSIGAIFTSCSPDFGVRGVLDRFGQVEPKVLFAADGYFYRGRTFDTLPKLQEIVDRLPSLQRVFVVPYVFEAPDPSGIRSAVRLDWAVRDLSPGEIDFVSMPFNHPLYIMYSSGTTGAPKCIVHGAGGTLLQHLKEHRLHCDVKRDERIFYFTTCGWMMWNWLVSALACEATVVLYDGSPGHPDLTVIFDLVDQEQVALLGTSAKFIDALGKAGCSPIDTHDLGSLRLVTSTGSPLVPEGFDYVYRHIKQDVQLASISGGTDIIGCFVLGNPTAPVWRGEIQCRALGMDVAVFDEAGKPLVGARGELVCRRPFPSMPVMFWKDPKGQRYRAAYFERFPGVWCHGDWVELTERGGMIIYGRSDATLNPGGVRIGTAEIYRQVERLDEVVEGLAIGQQWQDDVRVVLFVRLREGLILGDELEQRIRRAIRRECTPRHVPARIVQVGDIPRTKSGKITELAVRDIVHGRPIKNREALANPEALDQFAQRPELSS